MTKKARLKFERIQRMQIKNELLKCENELLFKMLFNREIALFWDFIEKDSIRSKITSFMKTRTMSHKAWQIFEFQIFKALIEIVAEMIKNRIKNDVLESCYELYRNSWFLMKKKKKKNIVWLMLRWKWIESSFEMRICFLRWTSFQRICWLRHCFSDEFIFRIQSIIVDWKVQKHDRIYDFIWFDENDHDFHECNQFND